MGMMGFAPVGKIKDHGVVEHRSSCFRHALETGDDTIDESHVMGTGQLANGLRLETADHLVVADVVHVHLFAFDSGQPRIAVTQLIDRKGHDVGKARNEGPEQYLGVPNLTIQGRHPGVEVFRIEFGKRAGG